MPTIVLSTRGKPPLTLHLSGERRDLSVREVATVTKTVYSDLQYSMTENFEDEELNPYSLINLYHGDGQIIKTYQQRLTSTSIELIPQDDDAYLFSNSLFYAELIVELRNKSGDQLETKRFYAERVRINIPEGEESDNIKAMADYLFSHYENYLTPPFGKRLGQRKLLPLEGESTWDLRLKALADIVKIYESQYAYFRSNARFKLSEKNQVDGFEKLHDFNASTAVYIATHPEELMPAPAGQGLRVGNKNYVPRHTLVRTDAKRFDVYENVTVLGFLRLLDLTISKDIETLDSLIQKCLVAENEVGYVLSTSVLMGQSFEKLNSAKEQMQKVAQRLRTTYLYYCQALELPLITKAINRLPEFTPAFQNIPSYRLIYDVMHRWFKLGNPVLDRAEFLYSNVARSELYEHFVLVRILEALSKKGLQLVSSSRYEYQRFPSMLFEQGNLANTFEFKSTSDDTTVTVYYEPVVKANGFGIENNVNVVRTSSLSLDIEAPGTLNSNLSQTPYYTPDFLVCIRRIVNDLPEERWFVADAKYSERRTVVKNYTVPLMFRYLFSMSPLKPAHAFEGLWLFNGKRSSFRSNLSTISKSANLYNDSCQNNCVYYEDVYSNQVTTLKFVDAIEQFVLNSQRLNDISNAE